MDWLLERIKAAGVARFLVRHDEVASYAELAVAVERADERAGNAGVAAGDVVALMTDYSVAATGWLLALVRRRAVVVPLVASGDEALAKLREGHVTWRVDFERDPGGVMTRSCGEVEGHPLLERLRTAGRAGLILFSSGSAGAPKAMIHDLDTLIDSYRERRGRTLTMLAFLLFDHIGGLNTLLHGLASGLCLVVPPSRDPEVVAAQVEKHGINILPASPTFLNLLLMSGATGRHDFSSLRVVTYGTEPMPESLLLRLKTALPRVKLIQTFGTSETGIAVASSASSTSTMLRVDDPNLETRVVDGELWLRSKTQILGYLNHDMGRFTADGWFRTGDLVEEGDGGFIRIVGRRTEMINVGGLKVLPGEVESVLLEMAEIVDCLVYGEANQITGQVVAAEVVPASGTDPQVIKARMRAHCRGRLEPYKIPARIKIVPRIVYGDRFKKKRPQEAGNSANAG